MKARTGSIGSSCAHSAPALKRPRRRSAAASYLARHAWLPILLCAWLPLPTHADTAVEAWVQRYHGVGTDFNETVSLAVDGNGDVIVTGVSDGGYLTLKYSSTGVLLWTNVYHGEWAGVDTPFAVAVDRNNDVIVTGRAVGPPVRPVEVWNIVTIKYSSAGRLLWINRYAGPVNYDWPSAVVVDHDNNVLVTGSSYVGEFPMAMYPDYLTIKYSSAGAVVWVNRLDVAYNTGDVAVALAVDSSNNVIVTGSSSYISSSHDYVTAKYSSAGELLWTRRYNGGFDDLARAVAVDRADNILVTGYSYTDSSYLGAVYATLKYSSAGELLWTNRYGTGVSRKAMAYALAVDSRDNVVVTGECDYGTNGDCATIKYSSAGLPLWTNRYNGPANSEDVAYVVRTDGADNVTIAGGSCASSGFLDFLTVQYAAAGELLWTCRYNGPGNQNDLIRAGLAVDSSGNVVVTGNSNGGLGLDEYATIKYAVQRGARLSIQPLREQVVLSWTNASFQLQSAAGPAGVFTNIPGATSPFTNAVTGPQQFFRLISN